MIIRTDGPQRGKCILFIYLSCDQLEMAKITQLRPLDMIPMNKFIIYLDLRWGLGVCHERRFIELLVIDLIANNTIHYKRRYF